MFEWIFKGEYIELHIKWRKEPLKVKAYIFLCEKLCENLNNEITVRGIESSFPHTIIPVTSIPSIHQLVQGVVHYAIYGERQHRVRNKGLLLAALILGSIQINDLVEILEKDFKSSQYYYLIGLESKPVNLNKCYTLRQEDLLKKPAIMNPLVKNVLLIISLT